MPDIKNFYRLGDGTQADPADVSRGDDGVLRHKSGQAVALMDNGEPMTIGQTSIENSKTADQGNQPARKPEPRAAETPKAPEQSRPL